MRTLVRRAGICAWLLAGIVAGTPAHVPAQGAPAAAFPDTVVFRFAPPESLDYTETRVITREKIFGDERRQADRLEVTMDVSLRATEDGYTMTQTPASMVSTRDGRPFLEPMQALFQDVVLTWFLAEDGSVDALEGMEGMADRARRLLPPEVARALEPVLDEESLRAKEIAEWDGRVTDFVGALVVVGDTLSFEQPFTLPNGQTLTYLTRLIVTGWRDTPIGPRLQLDTVYDSDARSFDTFVSGMADRVLTAAGADSLLTEVTGSRISGTSRRLVDPATLLTQEEVATRRMSFTMSMPGKPDLPVTMIEERRATFRY